MHARRSMRSCASWEALAGSGQCMRVGHARSRVHRMAREAWEGWHTGDSCGIDTVSGTCFGLYCERVNSAGGGDYLAVRRCLGSSLTPSQTELSKGREVACLS